MISESDTLVPRSVVLVESTSTGARPASFRPEIEIEGIETRVLVEQMTAVDVTRIGELAGHLSSQEQWDIDAAILRFGTQLTDINSDLTILMARPPVGEWIHIGSVTRLPPGTGLATSDLSDGKGRIGAAQTLYVAPFDSG